MTKHDRALFHAFLRNDFPTFLERCVMTLNPGQPLMKNWHLEAVANVLEEVRSGKKRRVIINLPPRYLKSIMVSVAFPAFLLGHDPTRRIIAISYGTELSSKHSSDFRSIVESAWYPAAFPAMQIARGIGDEIITTRRGFRKSTSVGGALTGLGGNLFIIDDPQKPVDAQSSVRRESLNQWFSNTLLSRLDNKETDAIIVVMQRVHLDDLSGYLSSQSDEWTVLNLAAIAETDELIPIGDGKFFKRLAGQALHAEHESLETLRKLQLLLGSDVFAAQYQQCPVPPGGAMIKREWLRYYTQLPPRSLRSKIIQSWDTAAKDGAENDWSVCTTWLRMDDNYYLIDLQRGRYNYPRLKAAAIAAAQRHKPDLILIEDASTGTALAQELKQVRFGTPIRLVPVQHDKIGRLYVQEAKFEAGLVHLPKDAPFLPELETELLSFPHGKTDDQVDSITQALAFKHSTYGMMDVL